LLSPKIAFLLVSFTLGELGDGLNIFQGIYLVGLGWNEGSVGTALSLMGLTALLVQPWAGDWVDKTTVDRRVFLTVASVVTALSASAIFLVRQDTNSAQQQHAFIFITKIIEGVSSSFIGPCLAALTLATFGPHHFDAVMASNLLWGHVGSVVAAMLAGIVAYFSYPQIQYCFFVIGVSAMCAVFLIRFLPQGDARMGRGFHGTVAVDEQGHIELLQNNEKVSAHPEVAASYRDVFLDSRSAILCLTGFFFHFANANVLLVLGELMSQDNTSDNDDSTPRRSAIPLIAGAIVTAQVTMAATTHVVDKLTMAGIGRKPLFMAGIATLPIRCALIVLFKDMGDVFLLSTQILDGIGGGIFGLLHPYLVADITFGTGRFNVLSKSRC